MPLTGWYTRMTPKPSLFPPLLETVPHPLHPISLDAWRGSSDPSLSYDLPNKAMDITGRTLYASETFAKKHNRSQSAQPIASSSSRPSANGHDPHELLRSQNAPMPQPPATYVNHSQPGPVYHSHTMPPVGSSRILYPEQSVWYGPWSTQDAPTYSRETFRGPPLVHADDSGPNQALIPHLKRSHSDQIGSVFLFRKFGKMLTILSPRSNPSLRGR